MGCVFGKRTRPRPAGFSGSQEPFKAGSWLLVPSRSHGVRAAAADGASRLEGLGEQPFIHAAKPFPCACHRGRLQVS